MKKATKITLASVAVCAVTLATAATVLAVKRADDIKYVLRQMKESCKSN